MQEHWANLDLHLNVNPDGARLGRSLEGALRAAVRDGRLPPGTRLPASRALAADLGIARNTVADAYGQLVAEGWLSARTGAGTWVTAGAVAAGAAAAGLTAAGPAGPGPRAAAPRYDLHAGVPDLSAFPRREWLAAARRALAAAPGDALGYPDARGVPRLREALAGYLARARGVAADPERIVVCAGFKHGLALLTQVLAARGARAAAVEAYSLPDHREVLSRGGLRLAPLPADEDGAVPDSGVLRGTGAAMLTPAHQFPLGTTLAPARRRLFAEWAAGTGAVLIEDDYDGEFRYDRHPVGAMQALAPDHVVYCGTASKALAPGLRLGWLAVPGHLLEEVAAAARLTGGPDAVGQLTLAEFISSGGYDRQVRLARLRYRRRRDHLVTALRQAAGQARVTGIAAGLHAVVELPPGRQEAEVIASAERRGVALSGLGHYDAGAGAGRRPPALVVGYAAPPPHAFTTVIARLSAALAEPGPR
jgi:GntR family transcriptional regulator/MocR family aminotransferase